MKNGIERLPPEVAADIERQVDEFRERKIAAALKVHGPKPFRTKSAERIHAFHESRDEQIKAAERWLSGETSRAILTDFGINPKVETIGNLLFGLVQGCFIHPTDEDPKMEKFFKIQPHRKKWLQLAKARGWRLAEIGEPVPDLPT